MSSVTGRLIKGSMWLTLSRAIVNGLSTLSTLILARFLVPADFGLVAIGTTLLVIVTSITELSLGQALIRHPSPDESHFSAAWTLSATRGTILALLFAAAAYPTARIYNEPRLVVVMLALSLSLFMSGLTNPRRIMLQRDLIFWQDFTLNVSQKVVGFIVTVAIAVMFRSYWALVLGTLAYQLTNLIVSYTVLPFWPRITYKHLKEFLSFSIWLTGGQIVNTLNWRFEYLVIGRLVGASALGQYTVGNTLSQLPTREATAPLTQTIYPGFAKVRANPERLVAAYQRAQALLTALALPAGIGMAVVARPLILFVMGEKWAPAIVVVQALASVFALQTLGSLVQPLGMAKGATRRLFIRDSQMLLLRLPVIIGGLILWGLPGVIYARVFTGILASFVNMLLVKEFIGVPVLKQLAANTRSLTSVAVMAAVVSLVENFLSSSGDKFALFDQLVLLIALGAVTYTSCSVLLWMLMGRPEGAETEVFRIAGKAFAMARRRAPRFT